VERRLFIRSDPPGATVVVNGEPAGATPTRVDFMTYGTFELILAAPGHHRLRRTVEVEPPWWETLPLDLFVETLWPATVIDEHALAFALEPFGEAGEPAIDQREADLRARLERGEGR
jgi:hypothetical protein